MEINGEIAKELEEKIYKKKQKSIKELTRYSANCHISRQTVMNTIRATKEITAYKKQDKKVRILYI